MGKHSMKVGWPGFSLGERGVCLMSTLTVLPSIFAIDV
jgi:hypothetical protein